MVEKELTTEKVDQELDETVIEEANESEKDEEAPEETPEAEETTEEPEKGDKADTKAEKRINKLTAINKSLQEELAKAKEILEEAKETLDRKDKALAEEKASLGQQFETLWTKNGKTMAEMTEEEFDAVIDECLGNADIEQGKKLLAECRAQRKAGKPIQQKQEALDKGEQELWEYEWGIISKAVLDEEIGNPELKKHFDKLKAEIVPVFQKRKEDRETGILYRQLVDGGVEAKMKHLTRIMKKLNIYKLIEQDDTTQQQTTGTISKGKKSPALSGGPKTFTRAQIEAMSAAEFEKNEAAIDKAMRENRIK